VYFRNFEAVSILLWNRKLKIFKLAGLDDLYLTDLKAQLRSLTINVDFQ